MSCNGDLYSSHENYTIMSGVVGNLNGWLGSDFLARRLESPLSVILIKCLSYGSCLCSECTWVEKRYGGLCGMFKMILGIIVLILHSFINALRHVSTWICTIFHFTDVLLILHLQTSRGRKDKNLFLTDLFN